MNTYRNNARLAGILYILGTVAGVIAAGLLQSIIGEPTNLQAMADHTQNILFGELATLTMAVALAAMATVVYPVLRQYNPVVALGYFGARLIEGALYIVEVIGGLTLITLSQHYVEAGAPADSFHATLSTLIFAVREWSGPVILGTVIFPLGALLFYTLLFRTRLVPRWLTVWGLGGIILWVLGGLMVMFDLTPVYSSLHVASNIPLAIQEMVLAIWLIVKGFNVSAPAVEPMRTRAVSSAS